MHEPAGTEEVGIYFPEVSVLTIDVEAVVIGGVLEGVYIGTIGYSYQSIALNMLKAKYGEPSTITTTVERNAFNTGYQNIHARWQRGTVEVALDGMVGSTDKGRISINTKKGAAFWSAQRNSV